MLISLFIVVQFCAGTKYTERPGGGDNFLLNCMQLYGYKQVRPGYAIGTITKPLPFPGNASVA